MRLTLECLITCMKHVTVYINYAHADHQHYDHMILLCVTQTNLLTITARPVLIASV